jgi:transposase
MQEESWESWACSRVLPKRWVVERTLGWINRARRLAKDFEATIESSLAWLQLADAKASTAENGPYLNYESGSQFH